MNRLYLLFHLARADFLERVRRYSFLVTLFAIVVFTYLCLPALDSPAWLYLNLGAGRPIYNSAWISLAVVKLFAEFFPLFGFYLVKNAIERDRRTGVGEIIATTPISKPMYTFGKWLSNMAIFGVLIGVTILTSLILQFVRAEDLAVDVWALVAPFLFLSLPMLAFIAALAVLFETINWLRGGFGNLVYYVVYIIAIYGDLQGVGSVWHSVYQSCSASLSGCKVGGQIDIGALPLANLSTFRFDGVEWTAGILLGRFTWVVVSAIIVLCAAFFFHRFDPSRIGKTPFAQLKQVIGGFVLEPRHTAEPNASDAKPAPITAPRVRLTPLPTNRGDVALPSRYVRIFLVELRLTVKGLRWPWYLIAAGIVVSALFVPLDIARLVILPLAMVWPVLVWSSLGVREVQEHTAPIMFALPYSLRRQLSVTWLVGVVIALVMGCTVIARLALVGDWSSSLAALIGALFVPSFAVALGCWSGTSKLFQAIYLFLWYFAAVQGVIYVDFMGHFPQTIALGIPWFVALVMIGLLVAAAFGRQRQVYQ